MTPSAPASPQDPPAPSCAKPATLAQCHEVIDTLGRELAQLREQLAWLQERMKLDSRNSSKPPSSDGPAGGSGGNRAQRRASGRSRGAQPGHKGTYRALLPEAEVQAVVEQLPPEVCECGGPVQRGKAWRHQVTDLPERVVAERGLVGELLGDGPDERGGHLVGEGIAEQARHAQQADAPTDELDVGLS